MKEHLDYAQYLTSGISRGYDLLSFEIDINTYICCIGNMYVHVIEDKCLNNPCYLEFENH